MPTLVALGMACATPAVHGAPSLEVAVSVGPLAEIVERLGGEAVRVRTLLPAGAAPENWSPSPRELLDAVRADLFVAVGHPSLAAERRLLDVVGGSVDGPSVLSIAAIAGSDVGADPHLWMDLDLMAATARAVAARLVEGTPSRSAAIEARLARLLTEVERVDRRLRGLFATARRPVVVQHPAWERLLSRYGVKSLLLEAEGKEPAPLSLSELIRVARSLEIDRVFTQSGLSDRGARLLAGALDAELVELDPVARDWLVNLERAGAALALAAAGPERAPGLTGLAVGPALP